MILLNYAHPLTDQMMVRLTELFGQEPTVHSIATHVDRARPLAEIAVELADAAQLSMNDWQTLPLAINPPSLAPVALALLVELHGRCGYFPPILNIRPIVTSLPPQYEIAEVVNLQHMRDVARSRR